MILHRTVQLDKLMIKKRFTVPIERVPIRDSRSILTVCAVFLGIAWITVVLRLWTRTRIVRAFGWDDAWMLVSIVSFKPCLVNRILLIINSSCTVIFHSALWFSVGPHLLDKGQVYRLGELDDTIDQCEQLHSNVNSCLIF